MLRKCQIRKSSFTPLRTSCEYSPGKNPISSPCAAPSSPQSPPALAHLPSAPPGARWAPGLPRSPEHGPGHPWVGLGEGQWWSQSVSQGPEVTGQRWGTGWGRGAAGPLPGRPGSAACPCPSLYSGE